MWLRQQTVESMSDLGTFWSINNKQQPIFCLKCPYNAPEANKELETSFNKHNN